MVIIAGYLSFFIHFAIDNSAVHFDQIAQQLQIVFTVAVDVHKTGQGKMAFVARTPYRSVNFIAGHDRIGNLYRQ